jgi:hypothetical protein
MQHFHTNGDSAVGSVLAYGAADPCSISKYILFFNYHENCGCGGCQISFIFKSLHLIIFFLPIFTLKNDRSAVGFSACYDQN